MTEETKSGKKEKATRSESEDFITKYEDLEKELARLKPAYLKAKQRFTRKK